MRVREMTSEREMAVIERPAMNDRVRERDMQFAVVYMQFEREIDMQFA
jgi:hypothetical protein